MEATQAESATSERRGIQSIEVGGALLQVLAQRGRSMMLRDLALAAGMPAAKAHPYLVSFGKLGLIEQDPATGHYGLGAAALQLGLAALRGLNPVRLATPAAARLANAIHLNVAIALWGNHGPTVVSIEECSRPIHVNMRPGTVMSLLYSATGRVFAAFLPTAMTAELQDADTQQQASALSGLPPVAPEESLIAVREHGMARALGQPIPGISAFSAPVFDHMGKLTLAITAMGPTASFDPNWDGSIANALRDCTQQISHRLGYAGPCGSDPPSP